MNPYLRYPADPDKQVRVLPKAGRRVASGAGCGLGDREKVDSSCLKLPAQLLHLRGRRTSTSLPPNLCKLPGPVESNNNDNSDNEKEEKEDQAIGQLADAVGHASLCTGGDTCNVVAPTAGGDVASGAGNDQNTKLQRQLLQPPSCSSSTSSSSSTLRPSLLSSPTSSKVQARAKIRSDEYVDDEFADSDEDIIVESIAVDGCVATMALPPPMAGGHVTSGAGGGDRGHKSPRAHVSQNVDQDTLDDLITQSNKLISESKPYSDNNDNDEDTNNYLPDKRPMPGTDDEEQWAVDELVTERMDHVNPGDDLTELVWLLVSEYINYDEYVTLGVVS